ncbi:4'-phosphopantetheinyl transferase superfamily-domain-containing protein [Peziza echinospora]|nr:4'-phosphopantetheinyl transferase superfamily-domain-containing protein [Peziza echinospora]
MPRPASLHLGVDLLHLPRLRALLFPGGPSVTSPTLTRFAKRILSPAELRLVPTQSPESILRYMATRWAAKEALYKAYPHPHPSGVEERITWKEVSVLKDITSGKPYISIKRLRNDNRHIQQGEDGADDEEDTASLTITHDGEYVIAIVAYSTDHVDSRVNLNALGEELIGKLKSCGKLT